MGGDDGVHQGEAEAVAAVAGGAAAGLVAADEPLEGLVHQVGREAGAVVVDGEAGGVRADGDGGAGGRVLAGVRQQVRDDLVQALLVADDVDRRLRQRQPPLVVGGEHALVGDGLDEQPGQVDVVASQRTAGVEPGQQQAGPRRAPSSARTPPRPSPTPCRSRPGRPAGCGPARCTRRWWSAASAARARRPRRTGAPAARCGAGPAATTRRGRASRSAPSRPGRPRCARRSGARAPARPA